MNSDINTNVVIQEKCKMSILVFCITGILMSKQYNINYLSINLQIFINKFLNDDKLKIQ